MYLWKTKFDCKLHKEIYLYISTSFNAMRFNISVLLIIISLSCNPPVRKNTAITGSSSTYRYDSLEGAYTGDFGGSNIRIILTHVTGKHAIGYNLLKGL